MNFGDFKDGKAQQLLPAALAAFEDELNGIASRCHIMCMNVLRLLAVGLKVCSLLPYRLQHFNVLCPCLRV